MIVYYMFRKVIKISIYRYGKIKFHIIYLT